MLLSLTDGTFKIVGFGDRYESELDIGFNNPKSNFVVSKNYTHVGFVENSDNPRLINIEVFNLFKIEDLLHDNMENKTVFPQLRII